MGTDVRIIEAGEERLEDLGPLWKALQRHHVAVGSDLGAMRTDEESWRRRKEEYREAFGEEGTFCLLAEVQGKPVGYAFVTTRAASCAYETDEKSAELKTLSVLEEYRGHGIGEKLMEAVFARTRSVGLTEMAIGTVATNERVIRFYERYGFHRRYVTLWGKIPSGE